MERELAGNIIEKKGRRNIFIWGKIQFTLQSTKWYYITQESHSLVFTPKKWKQRTVHKGHKGIILNGQKLEITIYQLMDTGLTIVVCS